MLTMGIDTRAIERGLNRLASSQLPFAIALGINDVSGQIKEAEETALARDLDRPVPFTRRGLAVARASKRRLTGVVGFKRIQAAYLDLAGNRGHTAGQASRYRGSGAPPAQQIWQHAAQCHQAGTGKAGCVLGHGQGGFGDLAAPEAGQTSHKERAAYGAGRNSWQQKRAQALGRL